MVLLLPPAPAARVLVGRAFATLSARSAAARRLIAVAGPPGAFGEAARAVVLPVVGELTGEEGRGEEDCGGTGLADGSMQCGWRLEVMELFALSLSAEGREAEGEV